MTTNEGKKFDDGKVRLDLLPVDALMCVGQILTYGANKYGARNWEKGMSWSRLTGAALRHMFSWMCKEDNDPETGISHLAHAACCILFLLSYTIRSIGVDDR